MPDFIGQNRTFFTKIHQTRKSCQSYRRFQNTIYFVVRWGMTTDLSEAGGQSAVASPGVAWCVVRSGLRDASCMMRMGPGRWESKVGKNREDSPFNAEDTPKTAGKSPELRHFTPCYGFAIGGSPAEPGRVPGFLVQSFKSNRKADGSGSWSGFVRFRGCEKARKSAFVRFRPVCERGRGSKSSKRQASNIQRRVRIQGRARMANQGHGSESLNFGSPEF